MTTAQLTAVAAAIAARPAATRAELTALVRSLAAVGFADDGLAAILALDRAAICAAIAGRL